MDPFTHALSGLVTGRAFISGHGTARGRVARTALVIGVLFPDIDVLLNPFEPYGLGTIRFHRGVTHSVVCLPVFAMLLGALAVWFCRWRQIERPSWLGLSALFGAGIGLHIVFDLITSFGTMVWTPLNWTYVAWDTTFIIDPVLTLILLLPLMLSWVYRDQEKSARRATLIWLGLSVVACGLAIVERGFQDIASAANQAYRDPKIGWSEGLWAAAALSAVLAVLFGGPAIGGRGLRVSPRKWLVGGIVAAGIYLALSAGAHAMALRRVEDFARGHGLQVRKIGALPMPPSFLFWSGLISTPDKVYHAYFSLLDDQAPYFREYRQSPPDPTIRSALTLPDVQIVLHFFRCPLILHQEKPGSTSNVEFYDLRFLPQFGKTLSFSYEVELDKSTGQILYRGKAPGGPP